MFRACLTSHTGSIHVNNYTLGMDKHTPQTVSGVGAGKNKSILVYSW